MTPVVDHFTADPGRNHPPKALASPLNDLASNALLSEFVLANARVTCTASSLALKASTRSCSFVGLILARF
jgi:hypothetical protein